MGPSRWDGRPRLIAALSAAALLTAAALWWRSDDGGEPAAIARPPRLPAAAPAATVPPQPPLDDRPVAAPEASTVPTGPAAATGRAPMVRRGQARAEAPQPAPVGVHGPGADAVGGRRPAAELPAVLPAPPPPAPPGAAAPPSSLPPARTLYHSGGTVLAPGITRAAGLGVTETELRAHCTRNPLTQSVDALVLELPASARPPGAMATTRDRDVEIAFYSSSCAPLERAPGVAAVVGTRVPAGARFAVLVNRARAASVVTLTITDR